MYKGTLYKPAEGVWVNNDIIIDPIPVRGPRTQILSVFLKISSGTRTDFKVQESIDGSDWVDIGTPALYGADWGVMTLKGIANYPTGTLLRVVATGTITIDKLLVVQDW